MPDNLNRRQPEDPYRINIHESWELKYWSKKFGVTKEELIHAVKEVGTSVAAVKLYLELLK